MTEIPLQANGTRFADRLATSPLLLALIAVACVMLAEGGRGFQILWNMGADNDSQVRLVQVRDLLAGQGWFDMHQYRLGMPEGSSMHWSRLVDAPIALIVLLVGAVTGSQAMGEIAAQILWPALNYVAAIYLVVRAARLYAGEEAMVPAAVIGGIGLYVVGIFGPGAIDHHNVQLVLVLAVMTFLLESLERPKMAYLAGAAATLSFAVGMETAFYVAFAGLTVSAWFLIKGNEAARATANYGIGFAATGLFAFLVAKSPSQWSSVECDAYSVAQFAIAALGGAGIAAAASLPSVRNSMTRRALFLVAIGLVVAAVTLTFFPQCLAKPYADMDPRLREYWMGSISEAQPIWAAVRTMPLIAANAFPPAIVALLCLVFSVKRNGLRAEDALVAAFLVPAMLVSYYQLRGANFALGFAIAPMAAMVAGQRRAMTANPTVKANLRAVGAWLITINMVWALATGFVIDLFQPGYSAKERASFGGGNTACQSAKDFDQLAAMAPARIVSITNLGSSILRYTGHHSYAGPYHRNVAGNMVALELLAAKPDAAQAIAKANSIDLVVVCRGNGESINYADGTLQAELTAGRAPAWLTITPQSAGSNLEIYRVAPK